MNIQLKSPLYAQLELTKDCNHFCSYCYNFWRHGKENHPEPYDFPHFRRIVDELVQNEVFQLTLTGGEPLLKPEILLNLIEYSSNEGIEVSLNSNLTLMDHRIITELKKRGLRSILGSLISYDEKTCDEISNTPGSFERTIRGIEAVVSAGVSLGINMVVSKQTLPQVYKTAELCYQLGVSHFFATRLNPSPYKNEQVGRSLSPDETRFALDQLLEIKQNFGMEVDVLEPLPHCAFPEQKYVTLLDRTCTAGVTWIAIGTGGNVRACTHIDYDYGIIQLEGLENIWAKMNGWNKEQFIPPECKEECIEYVFCGGGCRSGALCTGDIHGKDPLMTAPITVEIPHFSGYKIEFDDQSRFSLNARAKYRDEPFGLVVYVNPKLVSFFDHDSKKIFTLMNQLKEFKMEDIKPFLEKDPNEFVKYLLQKRVLLRKE